MKIQLTVSASGSRPNDEGGLSYEKYGFFMDKANTGVANVAKQLHDKFIKSGIKDFSVTVTPNSYGTSFLNVEAALKFKNTKSHVLLMRQNSTDTYVYLDGDSFRTPEFEAFFRSIRHTDPTLSYMCMSLAGFSPFVIDMTKLRSDLPNLLKKLAKVLKNYVR